MSVHKIALLSCGIAMFSIVLVARMPWTLVLLLLVAPVLLTRRMRNAHV